MRHAQYRLKKIGYPLSVEDIREELIDVQASTICDVRNGEMYRLPSAMTEEAKAIYKAFHLPLKTTVMEA